MNKLALLCLLALLPACTTDEPEPAPGPAPEITPAPQPGAAPPEAAPPEAAGANLPAAARSELDKALGAYERIRAALAADQTAGMVEAAGEISASAHAARPIVPETLQPAVQKLASEADTLAMSSDIAEARKQFGELSRAVVGLVSAAPELSQGRHVFSCPMAEGYQKWVQTKDQLENPYMGTKMLACGSKADWKE